MAGLRIVQRYYFTALLKRMVVLAGSSVANGEIVYISAVKGAPETIRNMVSFFNF